MLLILMLLMGAGVEENPELWLGILSCGVLAVLILLSFMVIGRMGRAEQTSNIGTYTARRWLLWTAEVKHTSKNRFEGPAWAVKQIAGRVDPYQLTLEGMIPAADAKPANKTWAKGLGIGCLIGIILMALAGGALMALISAL